MLPWSRDGMVYVWSLESRDLLRAIELPASAQTARKIEFVASNGPADKVCWLGVCLRKPHSILVHE
jgi:hypothetical protein